MTHTVIIVEDGIGAGGEAKTRIEWTPSHDIDPLQEAKRREKAEKLAVKINRVLYGPYSDVDGDED